MRYSFELESQIDDTIKLKLKDKLSLIGGVLDVQITKNKIAVMFRNDEDDVESVVDIIHSFGLKTNDNENIFPDISSKEAVASIIIFALIKSVNHDIFRLFLLLILLLLIANKILIYSFTMFKRFYFSNALIAILLGFFGIFTGIKSYLFPKNESNFVVISSFLLTGTILYHYFLNKRISFCTFLKKERSVKIQLLLIVVSLISFYFNNLSIFFAINFDIAFIRLKKFAFLCLCILFICTFSNIFPYYYYIIPSGLIVIFGLRKE